MTRNPWWTTTVAALLALAAGIAWAEDPQKAVTNTAPGCCQQKGCCSQFPYPITQVQGCSTITVQEAPSCPKCAGDGPCCSKNGACSHQAKAGCAKCDGCATCASAGKGSCCAKEGKDSCCAGCKDCACCKKCGCAKDAATSADCAKGCTCCCTKAASGCCCGSKAAAHAGRKKKVIVYVMEAPPMPVPPPPPGVYLPQPAPPAGPVTVVETPDGIRHIYGGMPCPAAPTYPCPVPAPMVAERVPPPAPVPCDPMTAPVPAQLTGSAPVPPPPAVVPCSVAQPAEGPCRCRLETMTEDGTTHLKVSSGPSTCITCDHLELKVAGFSGLKVAVADKQVRLHTPMADAMADRISVTAQEDQILLEGHVHLQYHLDEGEHADVSASRVVVHLADGRVEIHPAKPEAKATRMMPPADCPPEVFNFFTGISH